MNVKHFSFTGGLLVLLSFPLCAQDVAKEFDLQEVQVTAKRHDFGINSSQMSALAITAERINQLPKLLGEVDVLKSLQTLPGVQSSGEGRAGIFVRGGDYDQNLFLLDGINLYNPDHLQGFTSAVNADLMDDVVLYKGAFPSRFGTRLSSVIDIKLREGDMQRHHASITAGMLASKIQAEGPLWQDHTSFNVGARISYFNAIVSPLLKEVVYDNPGQMNNFSHMKYYDINAKLTHKFNNKGKLNAVFYFGRDSNNATPNETSQHFSYEQSYSGLYGGTMQGFIDRTNLSQRANHWHNLLAGLQYDQLLTPNLRLNASVNYSGYDYQLTYNRITSEKKSQKDVSYQQEQIITLNNKGDVTRYNSKVDDIAMHAGLTYAWQNKHEARTGVGVNLQDVAPQISTAYTHWDKSAKNINIAESFRIQHDEDFIISQAQLMNSVKGKGKVTSFSAYVEDDMTLTDWLKMNVGVRLQGYNADSQTHFQLEPRASVRFMLAKGVAFKASYARMSQGVFMLTSASLISPSEVWIPLNKDMKLGLSDQVSVGVSKDFGNGIHLSLEGYYKILDNVVDYREGTSLGAVKTWNELVAQGKGRAYGVEFLAQKTMGHTRGQISYTWSKSLRTFDREGMVLNAGKEFYAAGDRRHNFNINITQRLSKNWDLSASWTYQSGRRANITTSTITGGMLDDYNDFEPSYGSSVSSSYDYSQNPNYQYETKRYSEYTFIEDIVRMDSYRNRNSYTLPAVHRLDISFTHHGSIGIGEMICDVGIYNVYNRQNLSSVYWGYTQNRKALKGVCLFPIMPYITLTLKL
ncbi:MAG: TonB-dependent receptor [Bacteroidaceae bacterium]|nr:TonB-dependent receptor [Bacteroidaceae bacterium]